MWQKVTLLVKGKVVVLAQWAPEPSRNKKIIKNNFITVRLVKKKKKKKSLLKEPAPAGPGRRQLVRKPEVSRYTTVLKITVDTPKTLP
jgi:hypothetical protein